LLNAHRLSAQEDSPRSHYQRSGSHVRRKEFMTEADFAATRNFPSCMGTGLSLKPAGENLQFTIHCAGEV